MQIVVVLVRINKFSVGLFRYLKKHSQQAWSKGYLWFWWDGRNFRGGCRCSI